MTIDSAISRPRVRRERGAATVDRIIAAAEALFGTVGIEGASMRQIMLEAGVSNKSAVTYHFGDRQSLVKAIWDRRLPELEKIRAEMLAKTIAERREDDLHAIAALLFLPSYYFVDDMGQHRYVAFLGQALRWAPGRMIRTENMFLTPSSQAASDMLRQVLHDLPENIFTWRLRIATGLFADAVMDRDRESAAGEIVLPEALFLDETIRLTVACLTTPVSPLSRAGIIKNPL